MRKCARCGESAPVQILARCEQCGRWVCEACSVETFHYCVTLCKAGNCRRDHAVRVWRIEEILSREDQQ